MGYIMEIDYENGGDKGGLKTAINEMRSPVP